MKDLSAEERPKVGSYANEIRDILTEAIEEAKTSIEAANLEKALAEESIDVTLPGKKDGPRNSPCADTNHGRNRRHLCWYGLPSR